MSIQDSEDQPRRVDPAALATASLAAVLILELQPGRFGWLNFAVGLMLAFLVAAYYRPLCSAPSEPFRDITRAAAFGATAGLLATMVVSWPIQVFIVGTPAKCEIPGIPAGETKLQIDQLIDNCAGAAADKWVGWTWLISGIIFALGIIGMFAGDPPPVSSLVAEPTLLLVTRRMQPPFSMVLPFGGRCRLVVGVQEVVLAEWAVRFPPETRLTSCDLLIFVEASEPVESADASRVIWPLFWECA
jgi:hypothetical protein